jgi:hypothetical protein
MTHELFYIASSLGAGVFLASVVYTRRHRVGVSPAVRPQILPVDLEAFRNLMDPAEREYLRAKLSASEFRSVQRRRVAAALDYVVCVKQNAAILQQLGEDARAAVQPEIAAAGAHLVDSALRLRVSAARLSARLYLGWMLPGWDASSAPLADGYQDLCGLVAQLRRMRYANSAVHAAAVR